LGGDPGAQPSLKYSSEGRNRKKKKKNHFSCTEKFGFLLIIRSHTEFVVAVIGSWKQVVRRSMLQWTANCMHPIFTTKFVITGSEAGPKAQLPWALSWHERKDVFAADHSQLTRSQAKPLSLYRSEEWNVPAVPELWGKKGHWERQAGEWRG